MGLAKELLRTTFSAAKASVSVLLIIGYGMVSEKYNILTHEGEKNISHLGVTLFLPALLFTEIGPQATLSNLATYWIIVVLAIWYQLVSYVAGVVLRRIFHLPQWVVPCLIFNNVTSLPLLLFSSLESQGALDHLLRKSESLGDLARRARHYILIHALVCNLARFLFGPILLSPRAQIDHIFTHHETPHLFTHKKDETEITDHTNPDPPESNDPELQPLLAEEPTQFQRGKEQTKSTVQKVWSGIHSVLNPPMIGGLTAVIFGVIPFLRNLILVKDAPLSIIFDSIDTLGKLYTALQAFVLGGQLYSKRGSKADFGAFMLILVWRFFAMPAISISTVFFLRKNAQGAIKSDPVLDFVLAVVPVGPPAISLAAIADMSDISSDTQGSIDRTLMYSYFVTPLISLPVSTALTVVKGLYGIK